MILTNIDNNQCFLRTPFLLSLAQCKSRAVVFCFKKYTIRINGIIVVDESPSLAVDNHAENLTPKKVYLTLRPILPRVCPRSEWSLCAVISVSHIIILSPRVAGRTAVLFGPLFGKISP